MKKKFLSMFVASLMLTGGLTTFVSCSDDDYGDDITNLQDKTSDLNKQLAALQSALTQNEEAAKQAAEAAARAMEEAQEAAKQGDDAMAEAKQAAAQAELAKQAAAEAKAEAIAEVIKQLKPLIDAAASASKENASAIAALAGRIDGIEKGLSNIDLSDINAQLGGQAESIAANAKAIQALQVQVSALEKLQAELAKLQQDVTALGGSLSASVAEINGKIAAIESTLAELNQLKAEVEANKKSIDSIKQQLTELSTKISTEVSNAVNTIAGVIAQRLTSVTLMPDLYVGGIPTISFNSAQYTKLVWQNNAWVKATTGKKEFIVTNNETQAQYRLNPGTVTESDIDINGVGYYTRIATARSGEVLNDIVTVAGVKVGDNGVMTVNLGKGNTESLNLGGNKIYTVSLKVPIASKHLFTEQGETEAAVYSEFTRLEEKFFNPELAFIPGEYLGGSSVYHLNDSVALYGSNPGQMINKQIQYNTTFNLYDLVQGCAFEAPGTHTPMTREALQKYGFEIVFGVAQRAYADPFEDHTDQQKFVKLSGENNSILTPVASNGVTGNKVIIGKQPIIRAMLVDQVNKNIVDVRYLKVIFTAEDVQPVDITWEEIQSTGKPCVGASYDFTWKDMAEKVLMKIGDNGISKEEFNKVYGVVPAVITPANNANGTLTEHLILSNPDASIPVMTWTLSPDQLGTLKVGTNKVTVTKSIKFTDPNGLYPEVTINLKWTVTTVVEDALLGKTDGLKWQNNTMKVYPVPMTLDASGHYDGNPAHYATNILEGRLKPYVTGLLDCAQYDINYAASGNPVYPGEPLQFQAPFGHWAMTSANQSNLTEVIYSIKNDAAGKKLVSGGGIIKLDWSSNINGLAKNRYVFGTTNLQIVKILTLNTVLGKAIVDNSVEQTISIADNYTMTDAFGNLVAKVATASQPLAADYYQFYGIQNVKFGQVKNLADNAEGTVNVRSLAGLNMTADVDDASGILTFQNNGSPLQANAFILVPVTIDHLWGTLEGTIAVPLHKSSAPLNAHRK